MDIKVDVTWENQVNIAQPFKIDPQDGRVGWATGDPTKPAGVHLTWETKREDSQCDIDSELIVHLSAASDGYHGLVDVGFSTLAVKVWDDDRFGRLEWFAVGRPNHTTGFYTEEDIGTAPTPVENKLWRGKLSDVATSFGAAVNNSMGTVLRRKCLARDLCK